MDLTNCSVVLKFWADWCGPCHAVAPIVKSAATKAGVELLEIDIDAQHELATQFGVRSIPMVVAIKDGTPVDQIVGTASEAKYLELMSKLK